MTQTITIDNACYEVRELVLSDIQDLLGREGLNWGLELFKRAVLVGGVPIGEAAASVPLRHFTKLTRAVNELNGNPEETDAKD